MQIAITYCLLLHTIYLTMTANMMQEEMKIIFAMILRLNDVHVLYFMPVLIVVRQQLKNRMLFYCNQHQRKFMLCYFKCFIFVTIQNS